MADGPGALSRDAVRAEVLASWERSRGHGVDPDQIGARFVGHDRGSPLVVAAEDTFDEFFKLAGDLAASLVLVDPGGVLRARRDGHDGLARLLDAVLLVPGYRYCEAAVGTTAATLALHEQGDVTVSGAEHYHSRLTFLSGAASLVADPHEPAVRGAVGVLCHASDDTMFMLPLARMLAQRMADRMSEGQRPWSRALDRKSVV